MARQPVAPCPAHLQPEWTAAVLSCVSPFLTPATFPPRDANADTLVDHAVWLGVAAAWSAHVPSSWTAAVPGLEERARRVRHAAVAKTQATAGVRDDVVNLARSAGMRLVLLKGSVNGPWLYGSSALRSVSDVDVLVSAADLDRLHGLLTSAGYTRLAHEGRARSALEAFEWTYAPAQRGTFLDVHRAPCEPSYFPASADRWLGRSVVVETAEGAFPALCPPDALLHIAVHAASHGFDLDLRTFLDAALLLHRVPVDLDAAAAEAELIGAQAPLWVLLRVLEDLFGWSGGARVVKRLEPRPLRRLVVEKTVGWRKGSLAAFGSDNRARITRGIFPLLSGNRRAALFLVTYARRRLLDAIG